MNTNGIIDSYLDESSEEKINKKHEEVWNKFRKCSRNKIKEEAKKTMQKIRIKINEKENENVGNEVAKLKTLMSMYQTMEHMKSDEELPEWNESRKE